MLPSDELDDPLPRRGSASPYPTGTVELRERFARGIVCMREEEPINELHRIEHPACVVGHRNEAEKHEAGERIHGRELLVAPEFRLDGADTGHYRALQAARMTSIWRQHSRGSAVTSSKV